MDIHEYRSLPKRLFLVSAVIAWIVLATGCAISESPALKEARTNMEGIRQDSAIVAKAPVLVHKAEMALARAEKAWALNQDEDEVAHLAYLANQRVAIAEAITQRNLAEVEAQRLEEMRGQLRTEARSKEAEARSREAEERTKEAKEARRELAQIKPKRQAKETSRGMALTLGDMLFGSGKALLKPSAMQSLYRLVTFLKENPNRIVLIEGHTDSVGNDEVNLALSGERAAAASNFLVENGIDTDRVFSVGYGKTHPVVSNNTDDGRQRNRRVEIIVLREGTNPYSVKSPANPVGLPDANKDVETPLR